MVGGCRAAEFQRVGQDARQHGTLNLARAFCQIIAHDVMHHGGGAGQRADHHINRGFGFQTADQHMVINDRHDGGIVDGWRQFGGVIGIDDDDLIIGGNVRDDFRLRKAPVL